MKSKPEEESKVDVSPNDAIAEVWYEFKEYTSAKDPINQAYHLIKLSEAVGDLSSWHPMHNMNTGMIDGVYEED